jgi:hypothetical protein
VSKQILWLFGFTLACLAAALLLPATPQPLDYHAFADERTFFGIPNFLDVVSNGGFVVAGAAGLVATFGSRARFEAAGERWPYAVLFVGALLTGFGSAYYHLAPDNERLFWDRLPMTVAFMGLVASQLGDRISARIGLGLLAPLLLLGATSVIYWRATERVGAGNVVPYVVLQAYAVFVLLLASFTRSRYSLGHLLFWVFGWYVLSKVLEALDHEIFAMGGIVSGHTLKHLAAAAAVFVVWRMLVRRDVVPGPDKGSVSFPSARSVIG